jgi:hypothetical protein
LDKHTAYYNIQEALPKPGCVLCRLNRHVELKYIRDVLYNETTSVSTRAAMRNARGFCYPHAQAMVEMGYALDVSIVYQDILMTLKELLEKPSAHRAASRRGKRNLSEALATQGPCPACAHRDELEAVYVETLLDHLLDPEFVARFRAADPLCVAHLRQAIEDVRVPAQFSALRETVLAHWETLIAELGEFVRKHDHRFRHEAVGEEGTAWLRAVDAVAGTIEY